jgi:hypothetical protein
MKLSVGWSDVLGDLHTLTNPHTAEQKNHGRDQRSREKGKCPSPSPECLRGNFRKNSTPSSHYYLSLVLMYLDTKMCLDTSTSAMANNGRRD